MKKQKQTTPCKENNVKQKNGAGLQKTMRKTK